MAIHVQRRAFIGALGGAAAWRIAVRAQQPAVPLVGFLGITSGPAYARETAAFQEGLAGAGYQQGENVQIEYRWAENKPDHLPALAADLVHRQAVVIATTSGPATLAAKAVTKTIPIVFQTGFDPVETGFVHSLSRPDGNLTGVTTLAAELDAKRLELVHELVPGATIVAVLLNPIKSPAAERQLSNVQAAARTLGLQLHVSHASDERDLEKVFAALRSLRISALAIGASAFFNSRSELLASLALRHAVAAVYQFREFATAGGLLSYGGSLVDAHRLLGIYVGRIPKGEKPADLPVQQSAKVELILNLKTAKALGLTMPLSLLGRAEEIIE